MGTNYYLKHKDDKENLGYHIEYGEKISFEEFVVIVRNSKEYLKILVKE